MFDPRQLRTLKGRIICYSLAVVLAALAAAMCWLMPRALGRMPLLAFYPAILAAAAIGGLGPGITSVIASWCFITFSFDSTPGNIFPANFVEWERLFILSISGFTIGVISEKLKRSKIRQEQQALEIKASEERLRFALEKSYTGAWEFNFSNHAAFRSLEYDRIFGFEQQPAQWTYEMFLDHVLPEDRPAVEANFQEAINACAALNVECRIRRTDGAIRWIWLAGRHLDQHPGRGNAVVAGIVQDITQRKRSEEELASAKVSAERAKAVAESASHAKDHFLAVLSHELRTPLTPVVMGLSLLRERPDIDPKIRETLDLMHSNVEMEVRLIDDLLDVTRIARGKIELNRKPVELSAIIYRAADVCMPDIEARRINFSVDLGKRALYWVDADATRLQQVFWNLLKNAIKFTPRGGSVGIRAHTDENQVHVKVNDSGIGMEPEALSRIFNAFEQAEHSITRQFGGLGLGLAISKNLVEMHGGKIQAYSQGRNKGATFRVSLPLITSTVQVPNIQAASNQSIRPLRILLVEDHAVTAQMIRTILRETQDHEIETAGDIATALDLADRHPFDLLLSDLGLPDGSGHDLMRELRIRGHKFPGIALTGYGQKDDIDRSYESGFAAHLTKPASREAIMTAIGAVVSDNADAESDEASNVAAEVTIPSSKS